MSTEQNSREQIKGNDAGHVGEHTAESITQELFSLTNTKRMFRNHKWQVRHARIRKIFEEKFSIKEQAEIESQVKKLLKGQG